MEVTNCSNTSNISGTVEEYLRHLQDNTNITMIPAVIMLAIFAITGLIGNILVLVVYSQKMKLNPTKVLIMTIATFDLVANVTAIPSEVNIMFNSWNFKNPSVCKSKVFLVVFTTVGGAISLFIVAIIRYRRICHYHSWQVNVRQAIIASVVTAFIALLFSVPFTIIYGIRTRETSCPYISGTECFADDQYFYTIWPLLNNLLFVALYLFLSISMIVLYILIGVKAYKHRTIPGEAVKSECSSIPGVSSVRKKITSVVEIQPKSRKSSSSKDSHSAPMDYALMQALHCITIQQEEKNTKDDNQSAVTMKTVTISDTETEVHLPKTIHSEVNQDDIYKCDNFVANSIVSNGNFLFTELVGPNKDTKTSCLFRKDESLSVREDYNTQEQCLFQNIASNEPNVENQRQESEISKSDESLKTISSNVTLKANDDPKNARRRPLGRMTAMLIIISAIFVFGYFPFLILSGYKNKFPEQYANLNMVELTFYNLFYRLYFLNSAANAIIYSLWNPNFRHKCLSLLSCKVKKRL